MKEILTMGDVTKDFNRLEIPVRQTYNSEKYGICEVTDEELKILCDESNIDETWEDCGWRYCEGSNQGKPSEKLTVNNKKLICWHEYNTEDFEDENDDDPYKPSYTNLLEYLCEEMGCSQPRNVCALVKDLAMYNNMKMSELFEKYQESGDRVLQINISDRLGTHKLHIGDFIIKCKKCGKERPLYKNDMGEDYVNPVECECGGENQFRYWLDNLYTEEEYKELEKQANLKNKIL